MKQSELTKNKLYYFNPQERNSIHYFCKELDQLIKEKLCHKHNIVILCIGSDRATGDSLGPIIGYKLSKLRTPGIQIYGTLSNPVHAKNLDLTIQHIKQNHKDSCIIAIDASLGNQDHIGFVTLGDGSLYPGMGVDKELPSVGDIYITGIVNISGMLNHMLLQTTRLDVVMQLADYICTGLRYSFYQLQRQRMS
ncbi:spore protease GPR related protein [Lachnospiraceae bacterium KM106-2]|nr:spore protease GPR related protein [Lachnospiraceae bacterium KM106-2]